MIANFSFRRVNQLVISVPSCGIVLCAHIKKTKFGESLVRQRILCILQITSGSNRSPARLISGCPTSFYFGSWRSQNPTLRNEKLAIEFPPGLQVAGLLRALTPCSHLKKVLDIGVS